MFDSNRLRGAFTLVTGILLGNAGAALYTDARKDQTAHEDRPPLNLETIDAYSRDNLPLQAHLSIVGLTPAGAADEKTVRTAVIRTLKQQIAQKPAQELGIEQQLDDIRPAFMAQKDSGFPAPVTIELPQEKLGDLARSLLDTVRHTATGRMELDAEVRLTIKATFDPRNIERYYARKDRQSRNTTPTRPF